jgi:methylmalonyl-CoA mutase cobalamin-binding subunit
MSVGEIAADGIGVAILSYLVVACVKYCQRAAAEIGAELGICLGGDIPAQPADVDDVQKLRDAGAL